METTTNTYQNKTSFSKAFYSTLVAVVCYALPTQHALELPHINTLSMLSHSKELLGTQRSMASLNDAMNSYQKSEIVAQYILEIANKSLPKKFKHYAPTITRTIIEEANRYKMDPLFLTAVMRHESGFSPEMIGGVGEIGLMQIRPETAKWLNKKLHIVKHIDLKNPVTNIRLGAAFLQMLRADFKGESRLYIAAYNMGKANVKKLLKNNESPKIYAMKVMKQYLDYNRSLEQKLTAFDMRQVSSSKAVANL